MRAHPFLALLVLTLAPAPAHSQSVYLLQQCNGLMNRTTYALSAQDWNGLVKSAEEYMSVCSEIASKRTQEAMLSDIGGGLIEQGQYDDAIRALTQCLSLDADSAPCWFDLGRANAYLGRRYAARLFWNKAIEVGGFDSVSAASVKAARSWLTKLDAMEKSLGDRLPPDPSAPTPSQPSPPEDSGMSFGTGFFVTAEGHVLTNNHVIAGCRFLDTPNGKTLQVIAASPESDLALLKANFKPEAVAVFRSVTPPKLGENVVAFGFPLPGLLSSKGILSTGILSATRGISDNTRLIQISAPVQPGNSGGPLFDSSGHVIGVVVSKLDAIKIASATGDVPQNVNFAVHLSEVRTFLDAQHVPYRRAASEKDIGTTAIAELATHITLEIECSH